MFIRSFHTTSGLKADNNPTNTENKKTKEELDMEYSGVDADIDTHLNENAPPVVSKMPKVDWRPVVELSKCKENVDDRIEALKENYSDNQESSDYVDDLKSDLIARYPDLDLKEIMKRVEEKTGEILTNIPGDDYEGVNPAATK